MGTVRLLIVTVLLVALSSSISARNYWGQMLPGQPGNFIFGYGSLIKSTSRSADAGHAVQAIPARVSAAFGYVRVWDHRSPSGFTALGIGRPRPGEPPMTINGVLFPVQGQDMAAFDARESGYVRVEIPRPDIQAVSWQRLPVLGKIWVYVPKRAGEPPGVNLPLPNAEHPLVQSYIDVVIEGGLEYGPKFAQEILTGTTGWSRYWLNDRVLARRPWVFDKNSSAVDRLLAALAPHFTDRLLPEQYAAKFLVVK